MTAVGADPASRRLALTLGPVLFLWDEARWRDFYFRIADEADLDTVVIGETVCSKREHFHARSMSQVADRLASAGKRVRLASLSLVTAPRERKSVQRLAEQDRFEIEIGELSALPRLHGRPFAVGPMVNVYNAPTAEVLAKLGATSICLPPELPLASLERICARVPGIGFEVFAFGKVPLAISARCAHARFRGLTKDTCQFICGEDPDGVAVDTLDGQRFLALNGVQTVSGTCHVALDDIEPLRAAGVQGLRLSPQTCDMVAVAQIYRSVGARRLDAEAGRRRLAEVYPEAEFSNGFLHGRPGHELIERTADAR
jgi:collagenase-like PrtC family protease